MRQTSGQLVKEVAGKTGLSEKEVEKIVRSFTETVAEKLKENISIRLTGIGTLFIKQTRGFDGVCSLNGLSYTVPERRTIGFKQSSTIKNFFKNEVKEEVL